MNRVSDEDLLGYTLGALDADEQEQIDLLVREDAQVIAKVEKIRCDLAPLDGLAPPAKPRTGLARRTCECIAAVPVPPPEIRPATSQQHWFTQRREWLGGRGRTSVADFVAVAVILMLLAAIILPAVNHSRFQARVVACQDNMRNVGMALLEYANRHGGRHLPIPDDDKLGVAGIMAPTLMESGLVTDPGYFLCAGQPRQDDFTPPIPTTDQIRSATGMSLFRLQKMSGGDFAYSLGQTVDGQYVSTRNESRPWYVLLADKPSVDLAGRASGNHSGYGQNAFFEDGHLEFLPTPAVGEDSIYENDWGNVAPGAHADDCVVAPSATRVRQPKFSSMR